MAIIYSITEKHIEYESILTHQYIFFPCCTVCFNQRFANLGQGGKEEKQSTNTTYTRLFFLKQDN